MPAPREFAERFDNVRHWADMPKGGQPSAALEVNYWLMNYGRSSARYGIDKVAILAKREAN